jgi:ribonuclease H2 subunit C
VSIPDGYIGKVVRITSEAAPSASSNTQSNTDGAEAEEEDEDEEMEEVKIAQEMGEFDEIVVWEHGGVVDEERSGFVRGLGEWVGWAASMHGEEDEVEKVEGKEGK